MELIRDVEGDADGFTALSDSPWLGLPAECFQRGGFIEMRYSACIYDAPVRPLLRFWRRDGGYSDEILPAPTEGAAIWLGRAPKNCVKIWISPTNRPGRFNFRIDEIRRAPLLAVLRRALGAPKRSFFALSAGMVGLVDESALNWRFALGSEPISHYPEWRAARRRALDPALDRRRSDWRETFAILVDARDADEAAIAQTRASVDAQNYPRRRFLLLDDGPPALDACAYAVILRAGDRLEPHALACFAEYFARHPRCAIAYADAMTATAPDFRPGWSQTLHGFHNFVGRAACVRANLLREADFATAPEAIVGRLLTGVGEAGALHRQLFTLCGHASAPMRAAIDASWAGQPHRASIIIPTRDRPDLLKPCVESLLTKTTYAHFDVTIVDNGSVEQRTFALFEALRADARVKIQRHPGPFNFSALCNQGAAETSGDFIVFLNNDTEIITPDWIERLLYFASQPTIGAVGAKLLYPNGRAQHVGVLLGMGGVAGHFGAGLHDSAPGWHGRNEAPHDVSAVTGACLMVERAKFNTVGGFDAINLPVELNDVDLCLRLASRGWRTVCNPQAKLTHRQSASRGGGGMRLQRVYAKERRVFYERWRALVRDDPFFHPGLSLYSTQARLP